MDKEELKKKLPSTEETERLALLIKKCGEVIQAASKILINGYSSYPPNTPLIGNREHLEKEIIDLAVSIQLLIQEDDIDLDKSDKYMERVVARKNDYLHFNKIKNFR